MSVWLITFILAGFGALARVGLTYFLPSQGFPLGLLAVNVLGSSMMGYLSVALVSHSLWRFSLIAGFLGAFTTFSAFSGEVISMIERDQWFMAFAFLVLSNGLALAGCWLGMKLA